MATSPTMNLADPNMMNYKFTIVSEFILQELKTAFKSDNVDTNNGQHKDLLESVFEKEDQDNDGFISKDEFTGPKHDEL